MKNKKLKNKADPKLKSEFQLRRAVGSSVVKTLSDMAFIDAVEMPDHGEQIVFSHVIHIDIYEPEKGEIALFLPSECKKLIIENIYGEDWSTLHATEIDDCLLEILNVLTGNFLNEYCGKDARHNISLPELLFDDAKISGNNGFVDFYFDAEGIPFRVSICFGNH